MLQGSKPRFLLTPICLPSTSHKLIVSSQQPKSSWASVSDLAGFHSKHQQGSVLTISAFGLPTESFNKTVPFSNPIAKIVPSGFHPQQSPLLGMVNFMTLSWFVAQIPKSLQLRLANWKLTGLKDKYWTEVLCWYLTTPSALEFQIITVESALCKDYPAVANLLESRE